MMIANLSDTYHFTCDDSYPSFYYNPSSRANFLVLMIISLLVTVITLSANAILLLTLLFNKRVQDRPTIVLIPLVFTDLLQSFTTMPLLSFTSYGLYNHQLHCTISKVATVSGYCLCFMTISSIFLITFDQFMVVVLPFRKFTSLQQMVLFLLISWIVYAVLAFLFLVVYTDFWIFYLGLTALVMIVLFLVLCYCHTKINIVVKVTIKNISLTNIREAADIKQRGKSSKTSLIVLVLFVLSYIPFIAYTIFEVVHGVTQYTVTYVQLWKDFFALLNSFWNPFVCLWRLSKLRTATVSSISTFCCEVIRVRKSPKISPM